MSNNKNKKIPKEKGGDDEENKNEIDIDVHVNEEKNKHEENVIKVRHDVKKLKTIWITNATKPFKDDFRVIKQLGEPGQFGITYQCERKSDKKRFATKLLNKNRFYRIPADYRNRYLSAMHDEIEILQTLDHEYVIKLEQIYEDKPTLYIVMEECTGGELFQRIVQRERYTEQDAAKVIKMILQALKYMHEIKIVHCDLKPDNILFKDPSENSPIKIIDFGMSKVLPKLQYLTHLCGTPYYTAPEIVADKKFNHQCDMWSVGVIMFVMLFGYPPFYVDPEQYGKNERRAIYSKIKKGFFPEVKKTEVVGFGPWFPDHIPVSSEARDLIGKLLEKGVDKRYTAQDSLNHPWILYLGKPNQKSNIKINEQLLKPMLTSFAKFNNTCQLKLVVIKIFRDQFTKMRPQHFEELQKLFKLMDKDEDGIISYEEFEASIGNIQGVDLDPKYIKSMFNELNVSDVFMQKENKDKKKGIRFEDLLNALVHDYLVSVDERLYAAFRELDDDDDGKITTKQLKELLEQIDPLDESEKAMQIIEQQSLDKNGTIDYEEFLLVLHPNFDEAPVWHDQLYKLTSKAYYDKDNKEKKLKKDKKSKKDKDKDKKKKKFR